MSAILGNVTLLGKDSTHPGIPRVDVHGQLIAEDTALRFVPAQGWSFRPSQNLNTVRYQDGYQPLTIAWEHLRDWKGSFQSTTWTQWAYAVLGINYFDPDYYMNMTIYFKFTSVAGFGAKDTAIWIERYVTEARA